MSDLDSSVICEVFILGGTTKPVELEIDKEELSNAEQWHSFHEGTPEAVLNICNLVESKYTELYGIDPGHLEWKDLDIIVKIEVPSGA